MAGKRKVSLKITLMLDEESAASLERTAARLRKPKSQVIREAIKDYEANAGRLSDTERRKLLKLLDEYGKRPATKTDAEVDRELRELRESRRRGWSRPSDIR